jgi:hypothetical protein
MLEIFQQALAKIIAVIAALFIAFGIVKMPQIIDYSALQIKLPLNLPKEEIVQEIPKPQPEQPQPKQAQPQPESYQPRAEKTTLPSSSRQPATSTSPTPAPAISLTELNTKSRQSIVNIFCVPKTAGVLKSTTGSGVIISNSGIILTTAHIAQYFLLEDYPSPGSLNCVIRNGDIAKAAYDAKLLYIPSAWIEKNAESVIKDEPKGTGEDDYALLLANESLNFPFIEPNFDVGGFPENLSALIISYPAGFLGAPAIQKDLGLVSTFAVVKRLFTFSEKEPKYFDLFSLGGNIASQGGSSGGAIIDIRDGKLTGLIVTSTSGTTTAVRELNAITLSHINRSFKNYTGNNLAEFLKSPESSSDIFPESEFNRLKNLLIEQIEKR